MVSTALAVIFLLFLFVGIPYVLEKAAPLLIIIVGIIVLAAHIVFVWKIINDDYRKKGVKAAGVIINIVSAAICFVAWLGAYTVARVPNYAGGFSCGAIEPYLYLIMTMGPCIFAACVAAFNDDEPGLVTAVAVFAFLFGGLFAYLLRP